MTKLGFW